MHGTGEKYTQISGR